MSRREYTTREAAKLIGVSRQTLQAWCKQGAIDAPEPVEYGHVFFRFWRKEDIQRAKQFKGTLRPGPKPKRKKTRVGAGDPARRKRQGSSNMGAAGKVKSTRLEKHYSLRAVAEIVGMKRDTLRRWLEKDMGVKFLGVPRGSKYSLPESQVNTVLRRLALRSETRRLRRTAHDKLSHKRMPSV